MKLKVLALTAIMAAGLACGFASAETDGNTGVRLLSGKAIGSTVTPIRGVKDKSDPIAQLLALVSGGATARDLNAAGTAATAGDSDRKERPNHLELVMVIDQSGSMSGLEDDTIGGFNSMIERQKKDDVNTNVTAVVFNDTARTIYDREKLGNITKMTDKDYRPGGMTALMDAVGTTIAKVEKYPDIGKTGNKVLFVIITDGQENDSKEYTKANIKKLISDKQEKDGWEFVFLGANIDAAAEAKDMGIKEENAVKYKNTSQGVRANYNGVAKLASDLASDNLAGSRWKNEIDEDKDK